MTGYPAESSPVEDKEDDIVTVQEDFADAKLANVILSARRRKGDHNAHPVD